MQLPQIRIEQTYGQIGLHIKKPVQEIEQPKAELNLRQEPAVLAIQQPRLELSIDSTQARANIGLLTTMKFSDSSASFGYQQLMEAIAQISQEGDQLMAIETKANAIADLAIDKGVILKTGFIPPAASFDEGVDIHFQAKPPVIEVERRGMRMDPIIKPTVLKYTLGKVEGYMKQWPTLKIDTVGIHVNRLM